MVIVESSSVAAVHLPPRPAPRSCCCCWWRQRCSDVSVRVRW